MNSFLTPAEVRISTVIDGDSVRIDFDEYVVADAASNLIVVESKISELYRKPVNQVLLDEVRQRLFEAVERLQRAGVLVWNAFSKQWDVYDDSRLAHLQEGRA